MANYNERVSYSGSSAVSTLSGDIRLEESRGRLVIYDPINNNEIGVFDRTGYLTSDGTVSTKISPHKIVQNDGTNDRILLGDDK